MRRRLRLRLLLRFSEIPIFNLDLVGRMLGYFNSAIYLELKSEYQKRFAKAIYNISVGTHDSLIFLVYE